MIGASPLHSPGMTDLLVQLVGSSAASAWVPCKQTTMSVPVKLNAAAGLIVKMRMDDHKADKLCMPEMVGYFDQPYRCQIKCECNAGVDDFLQRAE